MKLTADEIRLVQEHRAAKLAPSEEPKAARTVRTTEPFSLKAWRLRMGWTQLEAAHQLGLSMPAYQRAEWQSLDKRRCRAPFARLARYLEADPEARKT